MTLTPEQLEELNWRWYENLAEVGVVEPGTGEARPNCIGWGWTGVLSNTFIHKAVWSGIWSRKGCWRIFRCGCIRMSFLAQSPMWNIFQEAAKRVGVEPEKILLSAI